MRKLFILLLVGIMLSFCSVAWATPNVVVNGKALQSDVEPIIQNERIYVPLRPVFEAMGFTVEVDENNIIGVHSSNYGKWWWFNPNDNTVKASTSPDKLIAITPPPFTYEGYAMVPLRLMTQIVNAKISWDEATETAYIYTDESQRMSVNEIIGANISNIVTVYTRAGQGSGFYFTNTGAVITNKHVVGDNELCVVKDYHGISRNYYTQLISPEYDIAFLYPLETVSTSGIDMFKWAFNVNVGDQVIAMGSPQNLYNTSTVGKVTGFFPYGNAKLIQTTALINSGSSGGALFNMNGEVVGITSATLADNKSISLAVPISCVYETIRNSF